MSGHSINTTRIRESVDKIDTSNLTPVEETELAAKALAKIEQYAEFYQRLNVGAELSDNLLKDVKRLRRYMRHRLDSVREAA